MPGLDFFGAHFASKHLVALAAVSAFFGWYALNSALKLYGVGLLLQVQNTH